MSFNTFFDIHEQFVPGLLLLLLIFLTIESNVACILIFIRYFYSLKQSSEGYLMVHLRILCSMSMLISPMFGLLLVIVRLLAEPAPSASGLAGAIESVVGCQYCFG